MSKVVMGLAGQPNVSIEMFNSFQEDDYLKEQGVKDMPSAVFGLARKRIMKDVSVSMDGNTKICTPHASETVLFPITT